MAGWIKLHRTLKDWEWYDDINATRLLIHLLLSVNYEDKKWKGIIIKSGSMVFSWETLSNGCGLTKQQCRTAMTKLINSKEVTSQSTNRFSVVTLVKWEQLQVLDNDVNTPPNKQITNKQQTDNKQITTTKESKEIKNIRTLVIRETEFKNSLQPYLEEFGSDLLNEFYLYWTEKKPKGRKMLFEMQKTFDIKRRLDRWALNDYGKKEKSIAPKKEKKSAAEIIQKELGINN